MIWTNDRVTKAVATLIKWHGTPHRDRIAVVGQGIDCVMLVNEVLVDAEILPRIQFPAYSTNDGMHNKSLRLAKAVEGLLHVEQVSTDGTRFGDIAVCRNGQQSAHVMFLTETRVWHSLAGVGVTNGKLNIWKARFEFVYRLTADGFKSYEFL